MKHFPSSRPSLASRKSLWNWDDEAKEYNLCVCGQRLSSQDFLMPLSWWINKYMQGGTAANHYSS